MVNTVINNQYWQSYYWIFFCWFLCVFKTLQQRDTHRDQIAETVSPTLCSEITRIRTLSHIPQNKFSSRLVYFFKRGSLPIQIHCPAKIAPQHRESCGTECKPCRERFNSLWRSSRAKAQRIHTALCRTGERLKSVMSGFTCRHFYINRPKDLFLISVQA